MSQIRSITWFMPGGKIPFFTSILPIAVNETGVAAEMGYDVLHALENHEQRISSLLTTRSDNSCKCCFVKLPTDIGYLHQSCIIVPMLPS